LQDYKTIARIAGMSPELENDDLMSAVRTWLGSQSNWLLVLDNADALQYFGSEYAYSNRNESSNLYRFIPQGLTGTILWTTRDERVVGGLVGVKQGINVTSMELSEAETLLANISGFAITGEDSKNTTRLGGDPCGVDPRVDLGLDRLGSQGSTLDRSRVDSRVDA
jgi:hypothetical protein